MLNTKRPGQRSIPRRASPTKRRTGALIAALSTTVLAALSWMATASLPAEPALQVSASGSLSALPSPGLSSATTVAALPSPAMPQPLALSPTAKALSADSGSDQDEGEEQRSNSGPVTRPGHRDASVLDSASVGEGSFATVPASTHNGGGNDSGGGFLGGATPVNVPVLIQEALDPDDQGADRIDGIATFGLPFPRGQVFENGGRPALAVNGSDTWQFRTLDTWDDDSVRWALVDLSADVLAGQTLPGLTVVNGPGQNTAPALARANPNGQTFDLDTGPLQASILRNNFNLLYFVRVDGKMMLGPTFGPSFYGLSAGGAYLRPGQSTKVTIEENGPARAVIRADGPLVDGAGNTAIDFTCRITARAKSRELEVTVTVRNASKDRPAHAQVERIELVVRSRPGANRYVTVPQHTGSVYGKPLPPGKHIYFYQGQTDAKMDGIGSGKWLPHIPIANPSDKSTLVDQGYAIVSKWQTIQALGDVTQWPKLGWLDMNGSKGGVTASIKNMPYLFPAALEASGHGLVTLGLWTTRNSVPYTFVYQQHESRTAMLSFHGPTDGDPDAAARRLRAPLTGRAANYKVYDSAGVLPYKLLTLAEHAQAYTMMGITHQVQAIHPKRQVERFLYKGTTGGTNNSPGIETDLAGLWLRHGYGGAFHNAMDLALWKSEWQVKRSDGFLDQNTPAVTNDSLPHTDGHQGDDEHRYRGGMALAYYLTGDERIRDALYDEAEVLQSVSLWPHERSMYQTLRAISRVAEFTHDPSLTQLLQARMDYISPPTLDIYTETSGYGWETTPFVGGRRYYVFSSQNKSEKPPGENFQTRGFISASLGPTAFFMAARHLASIDPTDPHVLAARGRLTDLAYWTYNELFPWFPDPADRQLVYSYAVTLKQVTVWEKWDFHPILTGMAEAYMITGNSAFLQRGVQQIEAHQAHDNGPFADNLYLLDSRLDAQHFFAVYRDWVLAGGTDQP